MLQYLFSIYEESTGWNALSDGKIGYFVNMISNHHLFFYIFWITRYDQVTWSIIIRSFCDNSNHYEVFLLFLSQHREKASLTMCNGINVNISSKYQSFHVHPDACRNDRVQNGISGTKAIPDVSKWWIYGVVVRDRATCKKVELEISTY